MTENYYSIPANAHIPPVVGEYGYYSSKRMKHYTSYYCTINSGDNSEIYQRNVSYSMSENITEFVPFTTNQGKIKSIDYVNNSDFKYESLS